MLLVVEAGVEQLADLLAGSPGSEGERDHSGYFFMQWVSGSRIIVSGHFLTLSFVMIYMASD